MNQENIYRVALTQVNGIGSVQARQLIEYFGTATAVFKAKKKELSAVEGIGDIRAKQIKDHEAFNEAESELLFAEKYQIQTLFLTDDAYPKRLLHCYDAPTLLYYRGNANLNSSKIVSIIGTRNNTDYGKLITEELIEELQSLNILVVSGLAFGIDAIAHKYCVKNNIYNVAVLAHGLDTIYPSQHKSLAKEILQHGGLLTEFIKNTKPDKHNFPRRNRIVAGMADATIVIETDRKGGSMITAELAYNYNRDLFAVPGRIGDNKSSGCLKLIQQNKAVLITKAADILENMGWLEVKKAGSKKQKELFVELTTDEKIIVEILKEKESIHIDELYIKSGLSSSSVAAAMLNLELQNIIASLPGKMYKLA